MATQRPEETEERIKYDAFISYSHAIGGELTAAFQSWLERFATPWFRPRSLRIFRDYTNLIATADLGREIEAALGASRWLILMASPESAASSWVDREVAWWREHKHADHVCIVLTNGTLVWNDETNDWDWDRTTALPPAARGMFRQEPLWVDLSSVRTSRDLDRSNPVLLNSIAQIAAPLRGIDKDALVGEHITLYRRARLQRRGGIVGLAALTVISLIAGAVAVVSASAADAQRREALRQLDIATSRQLAASAELQGAVDPQLGALLSAAAFRIYDTPEARTSLAHQLANQRRGSARIDRNLAATSRSVAFSPDGTTIASIDGTSPDSPVILWSWPAGTRTATLPGPAGRLAFSPGDDVLAVSRIGEVGLWDVHTRTTLATFPGGARLPAPIAFSPDGARLAIGGVDMYTITVWDLASRTQIATLALPPTAGGLREIVGQEVLAFGPTGSELYSDGSETGILQWDVDRGELVADIAGSMPCGFPFSFAVSPDGRIAASGCSAHSAVIVMWDLLLDSELARLQADGDVDALAFSPDGGTLVSGDAQGHVTLWDVGSRTRRETLTGHTDAVADVNYSPDGQNLVTAGADRLIVWAVGERGAIPSVEVPDSVVPTAFSHDGRTLVGSTGTGVVTWDVAAKRRIATIPDAGEPLGFDARDRVVTTRSGVFHLWDVASGRMIATLKVPVATAGDGPYGARATALSGDGRWLATVIGDGRTITVWDIERDTEVASLPAERGVSSFAFGPDGQRLAVGEATGPITVWDVHRRVRTATYEVDTLGGSMVTVAFSPDGTTLASIQPAGQPQTGSGCFGCEVIIWSLDRIDPVATLTGHTAHPDGLAFSADGLTLASTAGNSVILWSVPQRAQIISVIAAAPAIFSPDGKSLATARVSADGSRAGLTLWSTDPEAWRQELCRVAGRDLTESEWTTYLPDRAYQPVCTT